MADSITWVPLRIADAPDLSDAGVFGSTMQDARTGIREWVHLDKSVSHSLVARAVSESREILCVALLTVADRLSRRVGVRLLFPEPMDGKQRSECMESLFCHVFFSLGYWRIEMPVAEDDEQTAGQAVRAGMLDEGRLTGALYLNGRHVDARSFYLLRPRFASYGYGFVPFPKGLICILGGQREIEQVSFVHYGDKSDNLFLMESAEYQGLTDASGGIAKPDDDWTPKSDLPDEVGKACVQVGEYLAHSRSTFDVRIRWPDKATDFQKRVWNVLGRIGFGHVWTYEDVAVELVDKDILEARKLTRAVGSACASNPVALIVPCHRVIGKDRKLVGFSGGVDIKEYLLELEWIMPDETTEQNVEEPTEHEQ